MANRFFKGRALRRDILGAKVDKTTAAFPSGTVDPLFNIIKGRVILTSLIGEVTTAFTTGSTSINMKIQAKPTSGTTVDICADFDATNDAAGTLYGITGRFDAAMVGTNAGATVICSSPVLLQVGIIQLECGDTANAYIKWTATYIPLDEDAEMTPA